MKHLFVLLLLGISFTTSYSRNAFRDFHRNPPLTKYTLRSVALRSYALDTSLTIPQMQQRIHALQGPKIAGFTIGGLGFVAAAGGLACVIIGSFMQSERGFTVAGIGWLSMGSGCVLMVPGGLMAGISYYKQDKYRARIAELERRGF